MTGRDFSAALFLLGYLTVNFWLWTEARNRVALGQASAVCMSYDGNTWDADANICKERQ